MQCSSLLFEKLNQCRHCPGTIIYKTPSIFSSWGGDVVKQKTPKVFLFLLMFSGHTELVRKIKWGLRKSHVTPLLAVLLSRVLGMELFFKPPFAATHFHNITHPYSIIHAVISVCTCCNLQLRMLAEAYIWCRKKMSNFLPQYNNYYSMISHFCTV